MTGTQVLSIRLPAEVAEALAEKARPRAVSEYASDVLTKASGVTNTPPDKAFRAFKDELVAWVAARYSPRSFPRDVTLKAFEMAAGSAKLRRLHRAAMRGDDGQPNKYRRADLHRQTGQAIQRILRAEVNGRSDPLDGSAFIKSFTYLLPA